MLQMIICLSRKPVATGFKIAANGISVEIEWKIEVDHNFRRIIYGKHAAPPPI